MVDFPNEIRINPAAINKLIVGGIVVLLVGFGVMSSFYKVDPREHVVVLRLGEYLKKETETGLKFKLPFGIDKIYRVEVTTVKEEKFTFANMTTNRRNSSYSSSNRNEAEATLVVTGDLNVADVEWATQYLIGDAYNFLFEVKNPIPTFRALNESVMREVVGDRTIDEVLTSGREEIELEVEKELRRLAEQYKLGIMLKKVILQNVKPPQAVNESWDDVNQAQQEKQQTINTAKAALNQVIPKARGDATRIVEEAKGYAVERVNQADGDASLFKQVFAAYQKAPEVTRKRIYLETIGKVFATGGSGVQAGDSGVQAGDPGGQAGDPGGQGQAGKGGPRKIIIDEDAKGLLPLLNLNQEAK
mgnify:CR=1 FL=1